LRPRLLLRLLADLRLLAVLRLRPTLFLLALLRPALLRPRLRLRPPLRVLFTNPTIIHMIEKKINSVEMVVRYIG
tara:strand:+ start:3106 stop:3330 length:225 start_codon:yes stop_codon:yes gene_type:complete